MTTIYDLTATAAALPDVRAEVEANHDDNRWWPLSITDTRMRMLAAGWSTRVSYRMVNTYARVIREANATGFDALATAGDTQLAGMVRPIGLPRARIEYLRSLAELLKDWEAQGIDPTIEPADTQRLILDFSARVRGASFKVAQCALLYARGYHCGIIPVDSGMVTKLAPALGIALPSGPVAHERLRLVLEATVAGRAADFRALIAQHRHRVVLPQGAAPTWWVHLVLIYFKRLYLNSPPERLCRRRPLCADVIGCGHRDG